MLFYGGKAVKRFFYRNLRKGNLICVGISCILFCVILIVGMVDNAKQNIRQVNNLLSENYVPFEMHIDLKEIINRIKTEKNIIIRNGNGVIFEQGIDTEGLYFNGEYKNHYNIIEGRFFNKEDFDKGNKLVVIGKNLLSKTKTENSKRYIYRANTTFEVIGVMGNKNEPSKFDDLLIYNMDILGEDILDIPESNWIIDSLIKTETELRTILNNINKDKDSIHIHTKEQIPNPLKQALQEKKNNVINCIIIIICIFISLGKAIAFWINNISKEIAIRKVAGANKKKIYGEVVRRYSLFFIIATMISVVMYNTAKYLNILGNIKVTLNIFNSIIFLSVFVIIGFISISIALYNVSKIQIVDKLKGK